MKRVLNIRTTGELAYIDGNVLFDDCIDILQTLMGANKTYKLELTSEPTQNSAKASKVGTVGNTTQFKGKDGIFTVCNTFVTKYGLGKQFYYKINKSQ